MAKLKEGSVVEAIFAMYVACVLIDPQHGRNRTRQIQSAINGMRLNTILGNLKTKETKGARKGLFKQSVEFKSTYPNDNPALGTVLGAEVIMGRDAQKIVRPQYRLNIGKGHLKKRLQPNRRYFVTDDVNKDNNLNYPDFSEVYLDVKVKEAETGGQMGANLAALWEGVAADQERWDTSSKQMDAYASLKTKSSQLITGSQGTTFYAKLVRAKTLFLRNNRSDFIRYEVLADGITGEVTGGEVKQDVTLEVIANGRRLISETLNFSMKSDVKTFNNAGIYQGIQDLYDFFIKYIDDKGGASELKDKIRIAGQSKMNPVDVVTLYTAIVHGVRDNGGVDTSDSDQWWSIFKKQVFGIGYSGSIQIVDIRREQIKELTPEYVDYLQAPVKNGGAGVELYPLYKGTGESAASPGSIVFAPVYTVNNRKHIETDPTKAIFEWRFRYKGTGKRAVPVKIMSDLGGMKSIIHEKGGMNLFQPQ